MARLARLRASCSEISFWSGFAYDSKFNLILECLEIWQCVEQETAEPSYMPWCWCRGQEPSVSPVFLSMSLWSMARRERAAFDMDARRMPKTSAQQLDDLAILPTQAAQRCEGAQGLDAVAAEQRDAEGAGTGASETRP